MDAATVDTGSENEGIDGIDTAPTAASTPMLMPLWGEKVKYITTQASQPLALIEHVYFVFAGYSSEANARRALAANLNDIRATQVNAEKGGEPEDSHPSLPARVCAPPTPLHTPARPCVASAHSHLAACVALLLLPMRRPDEACGFQKNGMHLHTSLHAPVTEVPHAASVAREA